MNKFKIIKSITDIKNFSSLIFDILSDSKSPEEIESLLAEEVSEEGLRGVEALAQTGYPSILEQKQGKVGNNVFEYNVKEFPVFDQVTVSFQMNSHDWRKLEKSQFWNQASILLGELQKGHSQN